MTFIVESLMLLQSVEPVALGESKSYRPGDFDFLTIFFLFASFTWTKTISDILGLVRFLLAFKDIYNEHAFVFVNCTT